MKCGITGFVKQIGDTGQLMRFRCNCWKCDTCQKRLRRRLIARAKKGKPDKLITLTVNPAAFETKDEAAAALSSAWRRARQQLKRHHGHDDIQFLAVFEEHKSGWPHLHILVRSKFIPQRWLSRYMRERIASPIVDIRKIKSASHAAIYVAKYIAKAPQRFMGTKRYWTSQNWAERPPKPPKDPRAVWVIVRDAYQFMEAHRLDIAYEFEATGFTSPFPFASPAGPSPGAPP